MQQNYTKDKTTIVNLDRPARMSFASLFTIVGRFLKERRFDEVLVITVVSPFLRLPEEPATAMGFQEPITWSEQLLCTRVTAFSRTILFLERFWRKFRISFKPHQ